MTNDALDSVICLRPFYSLELNVKGRISVCCPAWSKSMVGNMRDKSLLEIWNDEPLQHMRRMMLEGRWEKVCRPSCPIIRNFRLTGKKDPLAHQSRELITNDILLAVRSRQTKLSTGPTWINFANSATCNLNCVMCGREMYHDDADLTRKAMREVKALLPSARELFLTGNGDPFARPDTREFMLCYDPSLYPQLKINLLTNGILLPRYWENIRHLNFGYLDLSVDAACRETYEAIRLGGKWQDLLRALEVAHQNRDRFSYINLNMTVMRANYREIPAFVELAARYGFGVYINRIRGKWGDQNFFTAADVSTIDELRGVIHEAKTVAEKLNVHFNASSFSDVLAGQRPPLHQRCLQTAIDNTKELYYKLKRWYRNTSRNGDGR